MMRTAHPVLFAAALAGAAASATATEILPVEDVRPGMVGVGRTVFEGTRIDEFAVEIIGVLENGPKQRMILARLEGGPLAETGVISGMSGSPVFVDGRLVGAVAYGFPFSKETIAGITPIGEMIEKTSSDAPRPAAARASTDVSTRGLPAMSGAALVEHLRRESPEIPVAAPFLRRLGLGAPPGAGAESLRPLALPLTMTGFTPGAVEWLSNALAPGGLLPVVGGAASAAGLGPIPDLEPGAAVGVSLVEGDLDMSVTGTVTHIDGDRVYAFGHPFYNLGPTQFPMKKAYVYSVFPSLYQSWKIASAVDPVGTVEQDRTTAIAGRLGETPRMIPVDVQLKTSRGQEREFHLRIVEDELFTPVLAYTSVLSVLQANERAFGTSTMKVEARVDLAGRGRVRVGDVFAEQQPALRSAVLVAAPLTYLMTNDFEPVRIERLSVDVTSLETNETATLARAWIERDGPVRPGSIPTLKVQLRTRRGETLTRSIPVAIPRDAPTGRYTLLVGDASAMNEREQAEMQAGFVPRDLDQLVRAINALRRSDHLYARLYRPDRGAVVRGEYLPSLPPSVLAVLGSSGGGEVVPIHTASVWDYSLATGYATSGSRLLSLTVER